MGKRYPAMIRSWKKAWEQFIPFLDYDVEIRKLICFTDENFNGAAMEGGCSGLFFVPSAAA